MNARVPDQVALLFNHPITDIIPERYSCRAYDGRAIAPEQAGALADFAATVVQGPLGTPLRFELAVAETEDTAALRGLGTYGLIKSPGGFIIGAASHSEHSLLDYGYGLEANILCATSLDLGTCWLGGNFTKSSFAGRIRAAHDEFVPAVASIGYPAPGIRARDPLRRKVNSDLRCPWDALFFDGDFHTPLTPEAAGAYAMPLAMLRLAPSSHNYQPWRVVKDGMWYRFFLQRTRKFGLASVAGFLLGMADLQMMEIGIGMCHFELTARELGLQGEWRVEEPPPGGPGGTAEYIVTWVAPPENESP